MVSQLLRQAQDDRLILENLTLILFFEAKKEVKFYSTMAIKT
ncbi:hypothetical protein SAMN04488024_102312 [Pedobacter soli]|uniref:Uncharacterized protein n=1 Tax=Pedobacter soli TaxID=390242 RepID=A0A1G6MF97_9SPHI|nr:hypothetical protein SAMN04488024_102312 [Pedobacter soli]